MQNWKTTLWGILTILAAIINAALEYHNTGQLPSLAILIAAFSTGIGLIKAADATPTPPPKITPGALVIIGILSIATLSTGCAWLRAHNPQIRNTLAVICNRAFVIAQQTLIEAAISQADRDYKADYLDSVALGLRSHAPEIVNASDVSKIVQIWSPNDGQQWKSLAGQLGTVAATTLTAQGDTKTAQVVESIATGLNNAAAAARSTSTTSPTPVGN